MSQPDEQARNDRKVRRLINQQERSKPITSEEVLKLCPYRTLFARPGTPLTQDTQPTCIVAALGFVPEDFSHQMRAEILTAIHNGEIVGLVSNRPELRDYAKREIALALEPAHGVA